MNTIQFITKQSEFELHCETVIPRPLDEVFSFFADAQNLQAITPDFLDFRIKSSTPLTMARGLIIDYSLRLFGIPFNWRSEITAWEPPNRFVDEQRKGPYKFWIHQHSFEEQNGTTIARDYVRYGLIGGRLIHTLIVKHQLRSIFEFRQRALLNHLS